MYSPKQVARFWSKVTVRGDDDCWPFQEESRDAKGYGLVKLNGKMRRAHVVGWEIANDMLMPDGLIGCHSCDTPWCCNPKHTFPGTHKDNKQDAMEKNRHAFGERQGLAKLTNEQVREIKIRHSSGDITQVALAAEYGVSPDTIYGLLHGKTWVRITIETEVSEHE